MNVVSVQQDHQPGPPAALGRAVVGACPDLAGLTWRTQRGGRVNRLWRVGPAMVKAHDPAGASPLFPNSAEDEALALARLGPLGLAPKLLAAGEGWVAYLRLPGRTWTAGAARAALALYRLHNGPADLPLRRPGTGSAALLAQASAIAAACRGPLPPAPPDPGVPPLAGPRLIHGDAVPGNLILGPEGAATLIDWQCPALADPAEDLAAFLSPAMQRLYRGKPLSGAEAEAFLAAYPDAAMVARYRALAALLHWRLALHCLWRAERGDAGYAEAATLEIGALTA